MCPHAVTLFSAAGCQTCSAGMASTRNARSNAGLCGESKAHAERRAERVGSSPRGGDALRDRREPGVRGVRGGVAGNHHGDVPRALLLRKRRQRGRKPHARGAVPAREVQADHLVVESLGRGDGLAARVLQVQLRHHLFQRDAIVARLPSGAERGRVGYVPVVVITPSSAAASPGRDLAGAFAARARYETVRAGSRALTGARGAGGLAPLFFRHGRDAEARRRVKTTRR